LETFFDIFITIRHKIDMISFIFERVLRIGRLHSLHLHIYPLANFAKRIPEVHVEQNGIDQRNISSCNGGEGSTGRLYEESGSAD